MSSILFSFIYTVQQKLARPKMFFDTYDDIYQITLKFCRNFASNQYIKNECPWQLRFSRHAQTEKIGQF